MKKLTLSPVFLGLLQVVGVFATIIVSIGILFTGVINDPVSGLSLFCLIAMLNLLIVLGHPLRLIVDGKSARAFLILRFTLVWLLVLTVACIAVMHFFLPPYFLID